ncbi:ATP-binding protein [Kitasatospora sp. NPDC008050]|uniref:nSTAND1 domain-containing NTPase n=1 Tax=Kitasatospora sp. NPDC008050 TaxID=3364021 RepID=UPI0036ECA91C
MVGASQIVTCAHVINAALGREKAATDRPADSVRIQIEFPLVGDSDGAPLRSCRLQAWDPPPRVGSTGRDVAGLVLVGSDNLPNGAGPARLFDHGMLRDVRASAFGYPGNPPGRVHGGWSRCVLRGAIGGGLIQLDTELDAALRTQPGYSGSPVVITDELGDAVIGMVSIASRDGTAGDAYAVPSVQLGAAWPQALANSTPPPCPYRGLRSFTATDAEQGLFVGREEEVSRLRAMVRTKPLVVVVGPSGVGKSSVVAAGLRPALAEDGWTVASFRPGFAPFDAVARALLEVERGGTSYSLDDMLARSAQLRRDGFWRVASQIALLTGKRIALLGDQFEEVISNRADDASHIEFLERILPPLDGREAAADVRLICTLRADFLPDLLALSDIGPRLQDRQLNISPLDARALARVIVEPARTAGVTYVPGLAEVIARDASRGPGGLPLLEFALTELWPLQHGRQISFDSFHQLGGVSGALNQHAEIVFSSVLESFEASRIRRVLLAMTRARGGASSAVRVVARRERLGTDWEVAEALAHADHRLVVIGPEGPGSAEIAHEALIREWARLADWVDEDAEFQRWLAVMEERAAEADFLSEVRVTEAERWLAERGIDVPEEIIGLVERSQSAILAHRATEERLDQSERRTKKLVEQSRQLREESWISGNLARISNLLQGRRELEATAALVIAEVSQVVSAGYGSFYLLEELTRTVPEIIAAASAPQGDSGLFFRLAARHGHHPGRRKVMIRAGETAAGKAAETKSVIVQDTPPGYLEWSTELMLLSAQLVELPVVHEGRVLGVLELASAKPFGAAALSFLQQISATIAVSVNTIAVNSKTEGLLMESQRLTALISMRSAELEARQTELEYTNNELQEKAEQLARQNADIEIKNAEIEEARRTLEARAEQLTLASHYKSQFLANMSHELRTPLQSLLILAKLLTDNTDGNLSSKEIEFAETIYGSGADLLQLIDDILDLSRVEAGKMAVRPASTPIKKIVDYVRDTFQPFATDIGLDFSIQVSESLQDALHSDEQRIRQVLRNLLHNAFKFTSTGSVILSIHSGNEDIPLHVQKQLRGAGEAAMQSEPIVAFSVSDTGPGIPGDKFQEIFEAFTQVEVGTGRFYGGGTGLGLSVSREIARLLGGEIHVESERGHGSTFTLYLPLHLPQGSLLGGTPAFREPAAILPMPAPEPAGVKFNDERVILVDGDIRAVFSLTGFLEDLGLCVLYAESIAEAAIALERGDIALVIAEMQLVQREGYSTIEEIRHLPHFSNLPFITFEAEVQGERKIGMHSGADAYFTKPIAEKELAKVIHQLLRPKIDPSVSKATPCGTWVAES